MNIVGLNNDNKIRSDYVYDANLGKSQEEINENQNSLNNQVYMCHVCMSSSGDGTFSGEIKFNDIRSNIGNCYSTSTGRFTCPVSGLYLVSYGCFTNSFSTSSNTVRPSIYVNGGMHIMTDIVPFNLVDIIYCEKGTTISAGAYTGSISFYQGGGHNWFCVALLKSC